MTNLTERYIESLMNTFGTPKLVFSKASGPFVWDDSGQRYLDFLSGIAVTGLGHCHPDVVEAITKQSYKLGHISNFFASQPQIELAQRLTKLVVTNNPDLPAKVFFANSGTEANEAAFKLTRLTGRTKIIAMEGSFHGRTMGALAVTSNQKYRDPFAPLPGEIVFVPYSDLTELANQLDESVAAVVLEPIQGENGVVPAADGFLTQVRSLTEQVGALLWVDEVQTGVGRCGDWFCFLQSGITPDVVTLAKGLANGFPIGACLATGAASELFTPGSHGSTFGGNPVAAAAANAVLDVIERDGLLERSKSMGDYLAKSILSLNLSNVSQVRGRGLLRGIVFDADIAPEVNQELLVRGIIANAPRANVLRLAPPLIISKVEVDSFVAALQDVLLSNKFSIKTS